MSDFIRYGKHWMWLSIALSIILMYVLFWYQIIDIRLSQFEYRFGDYYSVFNSTNFESVEPFNSTGLAPVKLEVN